VLTRISASWPACWQASATRSERSWAEARVKETAAMRPLVDALSEQPADALLDGLRLAGPGSRDQAHLRRGVRGRGSLDALGLGEFVGVEGHGPRSYEPVRRSHHRWVRGRTVPRGASRLASKQDATSWPTGTLGGRCSNGRRLKWQRGRWRPVFALARCSDATSTPNSHPAPRARPPPPACKLPRARSPHDQLLGPTARRSACEIASAIRRPTHLHQRMLMR
jgi:hypothetical protein